MLQKLLNTHYSNSYRESVKARVERFEKKTLNGTSKGFEVGVSDFGKAHFDMLKCGQKRDNKLNPINWVVLDRWGLRKGVYRELQVTK